MWHILIYLTLHLLFVKSDFNEKFIVFNNRTETLNHLAKCITNICDKELTLKPTVAIHVPGEKKEDEVIQEVITELSRNKIPLMTILNDTTNQQFVKTHGILDTVYERNHSMYTIVVTHIERCEDVIPFNFNDNNRQLKHLIIISDSFIDNCVDLLRKIRYAIGKYDITFILSDDVRDEKDESKIITFIPKYDEVTCDIVIDEPSFINTCINGTLLHEAIFPTKKPTNLNKCPLRVGMATIFPFSVIENKEKLKNYDPINESIGSDMENVKIFAEYFNASLELHYIYRKEENPGGDYEFLDFMFNGSLDLCAGGLFRFYGDVVAYSGIYTRQAAFWIYNAERAERSWDILIKKVNGLYIFMIFYISYSMIWYFVCVFDDDEVSFLKTLLYNWGALVGTTSLQDARSTKQKILNLVYLIMSIYFSAYIGTQLYSFLTIRSPPQMFKTLEDIMSSGRIPYLKSSTKFFISDPKYVAFVNSSADCESFDDCSDKAYENDGLSIVIEAHAYRYQASTTVNGEARRLRSTESLLTIYNEMLVRKDSPLVEKVAQVTQSLFEAGIMERLIDESIGLLTIDKADTANSNMVAFSYSCEGGCMITFTQIAGVFYVWVLGCGLSCIVFVIEIFAKNNIRLIEV